MSASNANSAPKARTRVHTVAGRRVISEGLQPRLWSDFYHYAMTASWATFVGFLAAAFVALNVVFAFVYGLGEAPIANVHPGSFSDLFFFSVETTSTVGYGDMHPQTLFAHIVATVENFVGLLSLALMTGLVFTRFSRPKARLAFSRNPVVYTHDGAPTLSFRVANERTSFISEATARLWMLGPLITKEGRRYIGFQPMKLTKSENPMFALTWTLFHPIDEESPLFGLDAAAVVAREFSFVLSLTGFDESSAQTVRVRHVFPAQTLKFNHEFVDVITSEPDGSRRVNYARIHDVRATGAVL